jgi:TonB family protein
MNPFDTCKYWPFALGPGIHAPRPISAPDPQYPEAAQKAKIKGSVVLAVAINEKGHVDDVKVVRSSDRRFEQNAMAAVKRWEFAPATKNGKSVAVQENVEVTFDLY